MGIVERAFRRAIKAAVSGNRDFRVTLELPGRSDAWVQLSWDSINAAYPLSEAPSVALPARSLSLPSTVSVTEWVASQYITFDHSAESLPELAQFVERYFARILSVPDFKNVRVANDKPY